MLSGQCAVNAIYVLTIHKAKCDQEILWPYLQVFALQTFSHEISKILPTSYQESMGCKGSYHWFEKLKTSLIYTVHFVQQGIDPCFFYSYDFALFVYMDDCISSCSAIIMDLMKYFIFTANGKIKKIQ